MGIEPTNPSLARRFIGFEDRGRHQSGTRFHAESYTGSGDRQRGRGPISVRHRERAAERGVGGGNRVVRAGQQHGRAR